MLESSACTCNAAHEWFLSSAAEMSTALSDSAPMTHQPNKQIIWTLPISHSACKVTWYFFICEWLKVMCAESLQGSLHTGQTCVYVTVATEATTITESPYDYDWGSAESFFSGWDPIGMLPSSHCFNMICGATLHVSCQTGDRFASFSFLIWFFKIWFILGPY